MSEEEVNKENLIEPLVVRTKNVAKDILHFSQKNSIDVEDVDFDILQVQTMLRNDSEEESDKWSEVEEENMDFLEKEDFLKDKNYHITQLYEVKLYKKKKKNLLENLKVSMGGNNDLTKVFFTIKKDSFVKYYKNLENDLIDLVNKKKLRTKVLIGIWEANFIEELRKLSRKIMVAKEMLFDKNFLILVSNTLERKNAINDSIEYLYKDKVSNVDEKTGKVDHSQRGFVKPVLKGELIIRYIKPKEGEPGRNCRGYYLVAQEPVVANAPEFNTTDNIKINNFKDYVEYISLKSGYIKFKDHTYDIEEDLDVKEIDFRSTGSIDVGLDKDIKLNIKQGDALSDSIGMGMEVSASEINVAGNVGPNATVRTKKITIKGQTHQSSKVYSDFMELNIHRGFAEGSDINIDILEHGTVKGEKVNIKKAIGGVVRAEEIYVEYLGTNSRLIASKIIDVKNIMGSENKLTIDAKATDFFKEQYEKYNEDIKNLEIEINNLKKELSEQNNLLKEITPTILIANKKIKEYKKKGLNAPASFVLKIKQYADLQKLVLAIKTKLSNKEEELNIIKEQKDSLQGNILGSKIVCRDQFKGYNEIKFSIIKPKKDLIVSTNKHMPASVFVLKHKGYSDYMVDVEPL